MIPDAQELTIEERLADLEVLVDMLKNHTHDNRGRPSVPLWDAEEACWQVARNTEKNLKKGDTDA